MKKLLTIILLTFFTIGMTAPSALAGAKQRHRWEGVAIGVGAAILGHAIVHGHQTHHYNRPQRGGGTVIIRDDRGRCDYPKRGYRNRHHSRPPRGHWESQRVWMAPVYEKVWNPGHYDANQQWVPGQWIHIVKEPGHWVEKREWVGRR